MSRTSVMFNGYELTRRFLVSDLRNPLAPIKVNEVSVPGMDGSVFTGADLTPRKMTVTITVMGRTEEEKEAESRFLAAVLALGKQAPLILSSNNGLYYMAVANASSDGVRSHNAISYDVTFTAHDPVAYGAERTVVVPSGGSVTFDVGGTYPTMPVVSVPSAANGSGGFWKLTLDGGDYLLATVPDGLSTAPVAADCDNRTLKVNSTVTLLDANANWLIFEPGQHTLVMTGTCEATVTFVERWL